jgi:serine/threonine-protein kinase HipA
MSRCPLLYVEIPDGLQYSKEGLRKLHPKLERLHDFPLTAQEQLYEAAALAAKISIQGVQPKLSVRLDAGTGMFRVVETFGQYIVKPPNPAFPELPENEDLTMRLASISGIDVPFHGLIYAKDGSMSYLIRRFDRIGRNGKLARSTSCSHASCSAF